jgi:hypothetical protein
MRWMFAASFVVAVAGRVALGQGNSNTQPSDTQPEPPLHQRLVQMTVQPAAEPVPALKYHLLPPADERIRGDAMTLYYLIVEQVSRQLNDHKNIRDEIQRWLEAPLEDLPKEQVRALLKEYDEITPLLNLATRQASCQWNLQEEELGFNTLGPNLTAWQHLGHMIALRARLAIVERRYDDAMHFLRMGYSMAQDVARGPSAVQTCVGIGISEMLTQQLESLIAGSNDLNLYWAIATLPKPLFDLSTNVQFDRNSLYFAVPELREAKANRLTLQQWEALPGLIGRRLQPIFPSPVDAPDIVKGTIPTTVEPLARQYWHARGLSDKEIDAMPPYKANVMFSLEECDKLWANVNKWFNLPYWQAQAGIDRADRAMQEATKTGQAGVFGFFVGSLGHLYAQQAILQQHLAALQTIEAVRIYAAAHKGKLPATLEETTDPPAPITPVTGKPFPYEAKGNRFVIDAPAPEGYDVSRGVRYEITVAGK